MASQTVDLLSKGDTQNGWEKVTTTSVMYVLKWHAGDYRVLVKDAEPMVVPELIHMTNFENLFFPVPVTSFWHMTNTIRLEFNDSWRSNFDRSTKNVCMFWCWRFSNLFLNPLSGWAIEYHHHHAWTEQICTSVWDSWGQEEVGPFFPGAVQVAQKDGCISWGEGCTCVRASGVSELSSAWWTHVPCRMGDRFPGWPTWWWHLSSCWSWHSTNPCSWWWWHSCGGRLKMCLLYCTYVRRYVLFFCDLWYSVKSHWQ